jgi:hypothetical protein
MPVAGGQFLFQDLKPVVAFADAGIENGEAGAHGVPPRDGRSLHSASGVHLDLS